MTTKSSTQGIDLAQLFGAAVQALAANQGSLNQADSANGNHGDHILQTFQLITQALSATQGKPPAEQLAYASNQLAGHAKISGSAGMYAKGLAQASQQMKGQSAVTPDLAMSLVQTLLGGGQAQQPAAQQNSGADLLGALLGGQPQQQSGGNAQTGLDMGDLLNAGLSFMQAKQQGKDNLSAAVSAFMSASPLGQQPHRQQSGEVVTTALLQAISMMAKK